MSRCGRRVAFVTWIDGRNVVVEDGRPGERFDSVSWPLALSDDGKVVAYAARLGSEQFCVAAGRKSLSYRSVSPPVVSADGTAVAFAASDGARWFAVLNGVPGPAFDGVGSLSLHPSGRPLAYAAEERARAFVVFDGRRGPAFDRVTAPVISRDGRCVAYGGCRKGRWFLVRGEDALPIEDPIASVFLSDDGSRAGYVVEDEGRMRVVGSRGSGAAFDWTGRPFFTEGGRVVYLAARGRTKFLVADEQAVELGEGVFWDPVLSADGSRVGFGAWVGGELAWKVMPLPPSGSGEVIREKGARP